jgi:hypothetical protein
MIIYNFSVLFLYLIKWLYLSHQMELKKIVIAFIFYYFFIYIYIIYIIWIIPVNKMKAMSSTKSELAIPFISYSEKQGFTLNP